MRTIQEEARVWQNKNFPQETIEEAMFGIVEEIGELFHSYSKERQGTRTNEDHKAKSKDAVGDIVIFLMSYCTFRGWDFEKCVRDVWEEVKQRDWVKYPENGVSK